VAESGRRSITARIGSPNYARGPVSLTVPYDLNRECNIRCDVTEWHDAGRPFQGRQTMSIAATKTLLALASAYGAVGLLIAAVFLLVGIDRVSSAARGAYAFRPLLVPGLVLLWPLVVVRWATLARTGA
jgi:hypothetical protein